MSLSTLPRCERCATLTRETFREAVTNMLVCQECISGIRTNSTMKMRETEFSLQIDLAFLVPNSDDSAPIEIAREMRADILALLRKHFAVTGNSTQPHYPNGPREWDTTYLDVSTTEYNRIS